VEPAPTEGFAHATATFFADDIVEILIDPGASRDRYFQFVVNAYGGFSPI